MNNTFQSTLPARGATRLSGNYRGRKSFQSTLPARGATRRKLHLDKRLGISIHAPRTGSDSMSFWLVPMMLIFQSTLPARGATRHEKAGNCPPNYFNPRSPHGERPACRTRTAPAQCYFNPRSPHGERPLDALDKRIRVNLFQSTLPARGATLHVHVFQQPLVAFQSTLPARGATRGGIAEVNHGLRISIHAPRTGSDPSAKIEDASIGTAFQSTLPARGATPTTWES